MLAVENIRFAYGSLEVLKDLSFHIQEGEIVTILGSNGAGKTTTLRTLAGLQRATAGRVAFDGEDITVWTPSRIAARGLRMVPEGRQLFPEHTVLENLELGAYRQLRRGGTREVRQHMDELLDLFPQIRGRLDQKAGLLSGGEQQMVALARALIGRPKLLMLDEPSLGLAPKLVRSIFDAFGALRDSGLTLLLVEQMAWLALEISDRAYLLESGTVKASGSAKEILNNPQVLEAYLGKRIEA